MEMEIILAVYLLIVQPLALLIILRAGSVDRPG